MDDGDDGNPGSFTRPWKTFVPARLESAAGDFVYARRGTYTLPLGAGAIIAHSIMLDGQAGERVTYRAYPGEEVILDAELGTEYAVHLAGPGAVIDGFDIRNATNANVYVDRSEHHEIVNNVIHDVQG
ncbi:MAG: hypothetical protein GWO22_23770, partial [Actinobacteria bacterium]|nr:hypothetical protein [Actinomycetota bacterium]